MPQQSQQANPLSVILSVLAGAGFKHVSDGLNKMSQSGTDLQQLFGLPNMPLLMAGAGLRDAANSMEAVSPIMKMLFPPPPPQPSVNQQQIANAMNMLSASLGPGLRGIQAPPMGSGMPGGIPSFPMG